MLLVSANDLAHRTAQHSAAIDAARAAGVQHVVYTSGLKPEPPNPAVVAPSHHATEQALRESGLGWTILRNSLYADYQVRRPSAPSTPACSSTTAGAGSVAYVAREDCAAAAAAVLLQPGHDRAVYEITGGESFHGGEPAALYAGSAAEPCVPARSTTRTSSRHSSAA